MKPPPTGRLRRAIPSSLVQHCVKGFVYLHNGPPSVRDTLSDSYEFIDHCDAKYAYPIIKMCDWIEVSRSGFYEWRDRPESATAVRRADLTVLVKWIFDWSDQTYGYRRVHQEVLRRGETAGPELVRDIMRSEGLVACQPRPWRHGLTEAGESGPIP